MAYRISPENPGEVELCDGLGNVMSKLTFTYDLAANADGKVVAVAASQEDAAVATVTDGGISTAAPL